MKSQQKYLYCVIDSAPGRHFTTPGVGDLTGKVHTINYKDIAMVVSDVTEDIIDPIRKNVLGHEKVNAEALQGATVVPMRFGMVVPTKEDVLRILKINYPELVFVLRKLKNKIELGLTVSWEKDNFIEAVSSKNPNIDLLKKKIDKAKPEQVYSLQIQLGQIVEAVVEQERAIWREQVHRDLVPGAIDFRINDTIGEKMVLNATFLVEKSKEADFDQLVDKFYLKYREGYLFKYSGPWPPWNFVTINLKME